MAKSNEKTQDESKDTVYKSGERPSTSSKNSKKEKSGKDSPFLMYKGRPLVRSGNILYYGNMDEKAVVMLQILSTERFRDIEMADKVQVQLMLTDPSLGMKERMLKSGERNGLYKAMDLGSIWLQRELDPPPERD